MHKTKAVKNICIQEIFLLLSRSNRKTEPLISAQLKKYLPPRRALNLSPQYGHVKLVSRYLVSISNKEAMKDAIIISRKEAVCLCQLFSWSMAYILHHFVVVRMRPRAISLGHEKINSWVFFSLVYVYGDTLGGLSSHRSSATKKENVRITITCLMLWLRE